MPLRSSTSSISGCDHYDDAVAVGYCCRRSPHRHYNLNALRLPIVAMVMVMMSWRMWIIVLILLAPCFEKEVIPIMLPSSSPSLFWWSWVCHDDVAIVLMVDALMIQQHNIVGRSRGGASSSSYSLGSTQSHHNHDKMRKKSNATNALELPFFRKSKDKHPIHHQLVKGDHAPSSSSSSSQLLSLSNHNRKQGGWLGLWKRKQPRKQKDTKSKNSRRHRHNRQVGDLSRISDGQLLSSLAASPPFSSSLTTTTVAIRRHHLDHHTPPPHRQGIALGIAKIRRILLLPSMFVLSSAMTPLRRRLSRFGTHGIITTTINTRQKKIKWMMTDHSNNYYSSSSHDRPQLPLRRLYGPHPPSPLMQLRRHVAKAASSANANAATLFSKAAATAEVALSFRGGGGGGGGGGRELTLETAERQVKDDEGVLIVEDSDETTSFVVETQLFPIVIPRTFQSPTTLTATTTTTTSNGLEISVASITSASTTITATTTATSSTTSSLDRPPAHLLRAASLPLLPKHLVIHDGSSSTGGVEEVSSNGFTGRELFYPETIEALVETGLKISLSPSPSNEHHHHHPVRWVGERNTDKFVKDHHHCNHHTLSEWYKALHSSQEILVWVGKFITGGSEYYGAELPIIKTTSIVHQSPKYLAELLMDSSRVRLYNKMSLGRTDIQVFQTGVDTRDGPYGDGESKVVRNLTKPPMVSSELEFVTFMHARRLRPGDLQMLSSSRSDGGSSDSVNHGGCDSSSPSSPTEGYIVVSRAIVGDSSHTGNNCRDSTNSSIHGEETKKFIRNEILLGVNILKAVPGEPNWTELTSVTHVYSPLIPLMLAKNAGVKGAVDFVRDIRALP